MEENSGVSFFKVQAALARLWLGKDFQSDANAQKTVKIKIPQITGEGIVESKKDTKQQIVEEALPETEEEAREIIKRFESGADSIRGDEGVADTVVQHMLLDKTTLRQEKWLGSDEEERNA